MRTLPPLSLSDSEASSVAAIAENGWRLPSPFFLLLRRRWSSFLLSSPLFKEMMFHYFWGHLVSDCFFFFFAEEVELFPPFLEFDDCFVGPTPGWCSFLSLLLRREGGEDRLPPLLATSPRIPYGREPTFFPFGMNCPPPFLPQTLMFASSSPRKRPHPFSPEG